MVTNTYSAINTNLSLWNTDMLLILEMSKDERSWKCLSPKPIPEITLKHIQI